MIVLDFSAVSDMVNHQNLLDRLHATYSIQEMSKVQDKTCDVPQGSILGLNLYEDYTAVSVGSILRKHNILFHIYADDTQVHLPFNPDEDIDSLHRVQLCLQAIRQQFATNLLKLNDSKTEFIISG